MWREYGKLTVSPATIIATCSQCPVGLVKYITFSEFPSEPIRFHIDRNNPPNSSGILQVHYWNTTPISTAPPGNNRIWIVDTKVGGSSFLFQPTPTNKYLSLYKVNSNNSNRFDAVCFRYIAESRLFVPQTFS